MSEPAGSGGGSGPRAIVERAVMGIVARVLGLPRVVELLAVLEVYDRGGGGLVAGGLAYTALLAVLPGLLLALSIVGLLVSDPADQEAIVAAIGRALPPLEDIARVAFRQVAAGAAPTGLIAIVGLLWGSSRFYTALDQAFARIFKDGEPRNPIIRIVRGVVVTGALVVLPVVLLTVSSVVSAVVALMPAGQEISGLAAAVLGIVSPIGALVLFTIAVALSYRYVPTAPPTMRAIALPAVLAGVILAAFTQLFAFIAPRLVGVAAFYGAFVAVFALLAWMSIGFNILMLGASWACVRARARGPATDAVV
jgi:membrane protein